MSILWLNFVVVFFVQLFTFLFHAYYEKKLADVPQVLWRGVLSGIILGPFFDLIGKYLGLGVYALGFGPLSLAVNAIFMYSLFAGNTLLMRNARLLHFCTWTFVYVAACEITNLFFPIWKYALAIPSIEYFIVAFGAPSGLAIFIALAWHTLFRYRFVFIDDVFKR